MKKKKIAIIINILIILLEIIGLFISIINNKKLLIEYFTIDSNILSLIASILFLIDSFRYKRKINELTKIAKYTSCVSLVLTFIIVLLILFPSSGFDTNILFNGAMPIFHIICPILVFFSFTKYERYRFDDNDKYQTLFFSLIYGTIMVLLNLIGILEGPYQFFLVRSNPIFVSIFSFVFITTITLFISILLQKIKKRFY